MILFNRDKGRNKVFCIGRNKTGTTSLQKLFKQLNYKVGNQEKAEQLVEHYNKYKWAPIIKYCKTANFFQDAPFSWPYTWIVLHQYYPKAKFILTTRDSEEWYKSLLNHHSSVMSKKGATPNKSDLKEFNYRGKYKGFIWLSNRAVWKTPEDDLYNKKELISNFERHNEDVKHYFKGNPNFIELDLSNENSFNKLICFLNIETKLTDFPHENKRRF
ncbi:hypothetical protein LCM02_03920 [Lutimonas saemankumensis]|uniref:sulfotransferase n=1 Tax=Lutimonas saemankumensis TaxID=483016 RepID=UPI001CD762E5|nr:sulfotransferase [Lutimonas saemankumensis]MCA0931587.1 hypothetical protein [Lutimonas saemankumensis]